MGTERSIWGGGSDLIRGPRTAEGLFACWLVAPGPRSAAPEVSVPDLVTVSLREGVAIVAIDNPPVNALDLDVRTALAAALTRLAEDGAVAAVVITGTGRTFVAGADIRELERAVWDHAVEPPDFHELLRLVEDCPRPIVMAMNGTALGGGLELAMAGHYRVAAPTARLGMPEVNLGIIPGAEGTQRLTRLVGVEKALEMCVSGKPIDAEDAARFGLVDLVIEGRLPGRRVGLRARRGAARSTSPPHARAHRQAGRPRGPGRPPRRGPREGAEDAPSPDRAPRGRRGDRGRGHAAFRRGLPPRARALARVCAVRAGARHGARLLRRTGCGAGCGDLDRRRGDRDSGGRGGRARERWAPVSR